MTSPLPHQKPDTDGDRIGVWSIQNRLVVSVFTILILLLVVVGALTRVENLAAQRRATDTAVAQHREALVSKGIGLVHNNAIALVPMVDANSFTDIRTLVKSTVAQDGDVVYGVFMSNKLQPWALAGLESQAEGQAPTKLDDERARWAATLRQAGHREFNVSGQSVVEFAAPVIAEGEPLGWIRYGLSTAGMKRAQEAAYAEGRRRILDTTQMLLLVTLGALLFSFVIVRQLAIMFTRPIKELVESARVIASGDYNKPIQSKSKDELGFLIRDVDKMRLSIKTLTERVREQERLKHEMELARRIQTAIVPSDVSGLSTEFRLAARMLPADEVGGDYYDVVKGPDGSLWIAIGDVSGHGVTPGLIMMMTQTAHLTLLTQTCDSPREVVQSLNQVLYENIVNRLKANHHMTFTTFKHVGGGVLEFAGAHLDVLVLRAKSGLCEQIGTPGVWLGIKPDISEATENHRLTLESGDIMILHTDGIMESFSEDGVMLDMSGLKQTVEDCFADGVHEPELLCDRILDRARRWCGDRRADDMTVVAVQRV